MKTIRELKEGLESYPGYYLCYVYEDLLVITDEDRNEAGSVLLKEVYNGN